MGRVTRAAPAPPQASAACSRPPRPPAPPAAPRPDLLRARSVVQAEPRTAAAGSHQEPVPRGHSSYEASECY
ncbi:hypothetical protein JYU34_005500 [Plutella xylostella]|uniref:Uncharacterized protein n=1 Tax=Plutella xylostella TaxID=51655 RepID=A0ABQ7QTD7_PLUXY|nr:hypothetical protein JYU34_005500 [Plutella xylostella]